VKMRIMTILLFVGIIPTIVISLLYYRVSQKNFQTDRDQLNMHKVQAIQSEVDALYSMHMAVLKLLARNSSVRTYDLKKIKPMLADMEKTHPMFIPIAVDRRGRQVAKTETYKMSEIGDRQFYIDAMGGKEEVLSEVVVSRSTGLLTVIMATPIHDNDGKVTGVMQGSINLMQLTEFVTHLSSKELSAFIVDKDGKIIAHPNKDFVMNRKDVAATPYFKKGMTGTPGVEEITQSSGGKSIIYYSLDKKTGWLICLETSERTGGDRKIEVLWLTLLSFIIALAAALAGYHLIKRIVNSDAQ